MTSNKPNITSTPGTKPPDDKAAGKLDLSGTQIVGGALAAMTAAALGSRLGVAGTLVGAALASIVAGIAGSLYTASLRHTREKVKTVFSGRIAGTDTPTAVDLVPDAALDDTAPSYSAAHQSPAATTHPAAVLSNGRARGRVSWKGMLIGALAAFAIAIVALTGFELISGSAISGGKGTTIEQASEPRHVATTPSPKPTPSGSPTASESPTSSESSTPEPSAAEPSQSPPSASETSSQSSETMTPSPTPSGLASSEPTPGG